MITNIFWNSQENRLRAVWRLALQLVLLLALSAAVILPLAGVLNGVPMDALSHPQTPLDKLLFVLPNLIPIALSVWLAGRWLDRRKFSDFGFHLNREWLTNLGFGLALGACLMTGIFVTELCSGWIHVAGTLQQSGSAAAFWTSLVASFFMFVAVGFQEELFSRGYQLTNIAEGLTGRLINKKAAVILAMVLSSVIFGALHAANPEASLVSTVNIMFAGLLLSAGYILTGELAIPIGLHITWNFFQGCVYGFPVSGLVLPPSVVTIQQHGNPVITGGSFGPEAGLIGLAAILFGTIAIAVWVKIRTGKLEIAIKSR